MKKELKVWLDDVGAMQMKLLAIGAKLVDTRDVADTYFVQPPGMVLKLTDSKKGAVLFVLRAKDGRFAIEKSDAVADPAELKALLAKKHGIKCELSRTIWAYSFRDYGISIHRIRDLGDFLIIESENPSKQFVTGFLGLGRARYVVDSFDSLKISKGK